MTSRDQLDFILVAILIMSVGINIVLACCNDDTLARLARQRKAAHEAMRAARTDGAS